MGTNPVAAAFPRGRGQPPLVIDLALSEVARGKIMVAAKEGRPIPEGWALDAEGNPTTDAQAALGGAMLAMGGTKPLQTSMDTNSRQGDLADQATGNNEVHIQLKLKQTDAKILQAIEEALWRME